MFEIIYRIFFTVCSCLHAERRYILAVTLNWTKSIWKTNEFTFQGHWKIETSLLTAADKPMVMFQEANGVLNLFIYTNRPEQ